MSDDAKFCWLAALVGLGMCALIVGGMEWQYRAAIARAHPPFSEVLQK